MLQVGQREPRLVRDLLLPGPKPPIQLAQLFLSPGNGFLQPGHIFCRSPPVHGQLGQNIQYPVVLGTVEDDASEGPELMGVEIKGLAAEEEDSFFFGSLDLGEECGMLGMLLLLGTFWLRSVIVASLVSLLISSTGSSSSWPCVHREPNGTTLR